MGLEIHFVHENPTIGYMENIRLIDKNVDNEKGEFNAFTFDQQYLKYMQILDSDFENFVVMYTCIEQAFYKSKKTGKKLTDKEVWNQRKNVR